MISLGFLTTSLGFRTLPLRKIVGTCACLTIMMEVGDVLKFAELAWFVYDYGWSPELNASKSSLEQ